jgi:hypothetical protein
LDLGLLTKWIDLLCQNVSWGHSVAVLVHMDRAEVVVELHESLVRMVEEVV